MLVRGQSLRGRLPLLSPAFSHSNLRRQVTPRLHDARDPSSEVWNYSARNGRQISPKVATSTLSLGIFYICDMGQTALLPLRRKACWGFLRPEKSDGFGPRTWVPKASTLPLDHRSRSCFFIRTRNIKTQRIVTFRNRILHLNQQLKIIVICGASSCVR